MECICKNSSCGPAQVEKTGHCRDEKPVALEPGQQAQDVCVYVCIRKEGLFRER